MLRIVLLLLALISGVPARSASTPGQLKLTAAHKTFLAAKEQQARDLGKEFKEEISPDIWSFFKAARAGDYPTVNHWSEQFQKRNSQYANAREDKTVTVVAYQTVIEASCFLDFLADAGPKYTELFGREILRAVPRGAIYFGGTDVGRGVVTALCKSHQEGDPFFTITQNALASDLYLQYLRNMYGKRLTIPTTEDSKNCFAEYLEDVQKRMERKQLKPGEDVRMVGGRVQVSGQVAVMSINAMLVKVIVDKNPDREVFIEESFPLEWMNPHLEPVGPIFKVHRQPFDILTEQMVRADREYWDRLIQPMIGKWLREDTTITEVCEFNQRVYGDKKLADFNGDRAYVEADAAQKAFSKLRSASGGIYAWRTRHASEAAERRRMADAADYAFRQSLALCPRSPEAVFRYMNHLLQQQPARLQDALAIARTAHRMDRSNPQVLDLVKKLEEMSEAK